MKTKAVSGWFRDVFVLIFFFFFERRENTPNSLSRVLVTALEGFNFISLFYHNKLGPQAAKFRGCWWRICQNIFPWADFASRILQVVSCGCWSSLGVWMLRIVPSVSLSCVKPALLVFCGVSVGSCPSHPPSSPTGILEAASPPGELF